MCFPFHHTIKLWSRWDSNPQLFLMFAKDFKSSCSAIRQRDRLLCAYRYATNCALKPEKSRSSLFDRNRTCTKGCSPRGIRTLKIWFLKPARLTVAPLDQINTSMGWWSLTQERYVVRAIKCPWNFTWWNQFILNWISTSLFEMFLLFEMN